MNQQSVKEKKLRPGGYRETLQVAYPLIISMGSFTVMQFVDRMFLAWHSAVSIQAALPAGILSFALICGFMELAGYSNTFVAHHHGAGDLEGCSRSTAHGLFIALMSWPFILLLIPFGQWILTHSGHSPEVLQEELVYFKILMFGGVVTPLSVAAASFFTGRGQTLITMAATVAANAINMVLDYALIFGAWGFPAMGIKGAAWATVLSGFVSPVILLALFLSPRIHKRYRSRSSFRLRPALLGRMLKYGAPSSVHLTLDVASFSIFFLFTGRMGEVALTASNLALSINMIAFLPMIGIGVAAATLVGKYQGQQASQDAERAGWTALRIGLIYMFVIGLTYLLFPEQYFSLFAYRAESSAVLEAAIPIGKKLLVFMALWGIMDTGNIILGGALKGAGDTKFVMIYSLVMAWGVLVAGQVVIVFVLEKGIIACWAWITFYIMILALGYLWRFMQGRWKSINLLGAVPTIQKMRPCGEALTRILHER